jgi:uncharacterized protein GlcG (DUF336 family)
MKKMSLLAVLLVVAGASHAEIRSERVLPLSLANQLAGQAVAACQDKGFAVTATVVDRAGQIKAVQRADNAGPHTLDSSLRKAYTSASMKAATSAILEIAQKNPAAAHLGEIPGLLLLAGGVPVKVGNDVVGAIGVGGAPGGHLDEQCAQAALDKSRALLK